MKIDWKNDNRWVFVGFTLMWILDKLIMYILFYIANNG